jgi:hypothetical protein
MTTTSIRQRIEDRLNLVEQMLISRKHISDPDTALETIASVSKFYSVLTEEQRDFINAARWAIEEQMEWELESA